MGLYWVYEFSTGNKMAEPRVKEVAHLPKELSEWLNKQADKTFTSKSAIIGMALRQYRVKNK